MSDTPKTDAFEALVDRPINWWDFARQLERENAALREKFMFAESEIILLREEREELREDKERLDWLESGCSCDLSWVGKEAPPSALTSLRNAIDWTRKEART